MLDWANINTRRIDDALYGPLSAEEDSVRGTCKDASIFKMKIKDELLTKLEAATTRAERAKREEESVEAEARARETNFPEPRNITAEEAPMRLYSGSNLTRILILMATNPNPNHNLNP